MPPLSCTTSQLRSFNGKLLSTVCRCVSFAVHLNPYLVKKYLTAREGMRRFAEYFHLD